MEYATLWKRILNEGFGVRALSQDIEHARRHIITAPIIADTRPPAPTNEWRACSVPIAIPFLPRFWVETSLSDTILAGGLCSARAIEGGWELRVLTFYGESGRRAHAFGATAWDCLSSAPPKCRYIETSQAVADFQDDRINGKQALFAIGSLILDVLAMLSCRNVSLAAHDHEPQTTRRAVKRYGGSPDKFKYHTLVVRPPGARHDSPGIDIGVMPRHLCRGHFAEYGPEFNKGLLFGKYAGRFFIPPHLKGDRKNGIVEKDYVVPAA